MFRTITETSAIHDDGSLYIFLGKHPHTDVKHKLNISVVTEDSLNAIKQLPLKMMLAGLTLVINPTTYQQYKPWIDAIQKHLAMVYCKHVLFPRQSATIPDSAGARSQDNYILMQREIQKAENIPTYLQSPLCNRLKGIGKDYPVAILLPGPSLNTFASRMKELHEKCIIVCVPRTVDFCIKAGVQPDFVVSLDTAARMRHQVRPATALSDSYLVALSPGALAYPSSFYRGIFLMESFDTNALPNPYRLRESWLSCAISTLGLAELLQTTIIFLVGGDHSWEDKQNTTTQTYWNTGFLNSTSSDSIRHAPPPRDTNQGPILVRDLDEWSPGGTPADAHMQIDASQPMQGLPDINTIFTLPDRKGNTVSTYFHYFAISAELELVAHEIAEKNAAKTYLLQDCGILSKEVFLPGGDTVLDGLKAINRSTFLKLADTAHATKERINIEKLKSQIKSLSQTVAHQTAYLTFCLADNRIQEALSHPYTISVDSSSAQRNMVAVRDYKLRVKFDCDFNFYKYQIHRLNIDIHDFPLLKKEFYENRIHECQSSITESNFSEICKTLFSDEDIHVIESTIRACTAWHTKLNASLAFCDFFQQATTGGTIVLWCLPGEQTKLFTAASKLIGPFTPHFALIASEDNISQPNKRTEYINENDFLLLANTCRHPQITSINFEHAYSYLLDLADKQKILSATTLGINTD